MVKPSLCITSKLLNTQRVENIQAWVRTLRSLSSGRQRYGQMCTFSLTGTFTSNTRFPHGLLQVWSLFSEPGSRTMAETEHLYKYILTSLLDAPKHRRSALCSDPGSLMSPSFIFPQEELNKWAPDEILMVRNSRLASVITCGLLGFLSLILFTTIALPSWSKVDQNCHNSHFCCADAVIYSRRRMQAYLLRDFGLSC